MKYRIFQLTTFKPSDLPDRQPGIHYFGRFKILEEITTPYLDSSTVFDTLEEAEKHLNYAKEKESLQSLELVILTVFV